MASIFSLAIASRPAFTAGLYHPIRASGMKNVARISSETFSLIGIDVPSLRIVLTSMATDFSLPVSFL